MNPEFGNDGNLIAFGIVFVNRSRCFVMPDLIRHPETLGKAG
jgi:hypothetical protein